MLGTPSHMYDIAIIGGGINGCGIARDAAGRGYSVFLAEMNDLASGTSSASTKLIHGGLRYLEHYELRLVREALAEREVLWAMAPHVVTPMRFVLPHHRDMRPAWLLRLGLFLYDHIGGRERLPGTRTLNVKKSLLAQVLQPRFARAFEYSDCWVDDARLVVLNARDAADRGAVIETRTRVIEARRDNGHWAIRLRLAAGHRERTIKSRLLVNAAGPWAGEVRAEGERPRIRLVKGSHIVVPRIGAHEEALFFQNNDGRIIFVIPYENRFTLIGTTDEDYAGDPAEVRITDREIAYLCRMASEYLARAVTPTDVVWTYSGVRALYDDGASKAQEATRDYVLKTQGGGDTALLIDVLGGKITTYRRLAEAVMERIEMAIGSRTRRSWTRGATLPGGSFAVDGAAALVTELCAAYPFLTGETARRLVRNYGTIASKFLDGARSAGDLGASFGAGLSEREVRHLIANEWARTADDILWRRTKLGLHMTVEQRHALAGWLATSGLVDELPGATQADHT